MKYSHFELAGTPLNIENLSIAPKDIQKPIVEGINLSIPEKCRAALVGANGTGKSTLLRSIAGLIKPISGRISIFGMPARIGNPRVAFLTQRSLFDWQFPVSVEKIVLSGRYIYGGFFKRISRDDREKAEKAMCLLKISDFAKRNISELSGGQQQRVLLARAICQDAQLLLLDEPYAGLDSKSRDIVDCFLFGNSGHNLTLLMATHDLSDALCHFDKILKVENNKLCVLKKCSGHNHLAFL